MCSGNGMNVSGAVGWDPANFRYVPDFYEFDAQDTTGSQEKEVTLQGINEPGLDHVLIAAIAQDKGTIAGTASAKVQVKVLPQVQRGLGGGDVYNTFAALDTDQQTRMAFGVRLQPNEDCIVKVKPNVITTIRVRVERYRAFRR